MTKRIVIFANRPIGFIYLSPHPTDTAVKIVTLVPLAKQGRFSENNLEVVLEKPVTEFLPVDLTEPQVCEQILGLAGIEPWKVTVK